ncbi:MAG: alpha/beta hydrolase family protein [Planctomycetaceae bacterium]
MDAMRFALVMLIAVAGLVPSRAADPRFGPPVTVDGEHAFTAVGSAEAWSERARLVRARVALAAGLLPMPARPPVEATLHGRIDRDGYSIERVSFESFAGHVVTGNLYRPAGGDAGSRPGVLCPYGHWPGGRFMDMPEEAVAKEIESGAERFVNGARSPLQARCVGLARLGCVVLHYDMVGFCDSVQVLGHRHGVAADLDGREPGTWGLGGFEAAARLQNWFGLQTFNSLRALDLLAALPGVDPTRLAATGASGGATQTIAVAAVDDRLRAAFAASMISTSMQGGCICENAPYLRVGQGNIDLAALVAPRALGLTAANDWTRDLERQGYPDLLGLYQMLGVPGMFEAHFDIQYGHNDNAVARSHCLRFMDRHLGLAQPTAGDEADFTFSSKPDLTVWTAEHPPPVGDDVGAAHERRLCAAWTAASDAAVGPVLDAGDREAASRAQATLAPAWAAIFGRGVPSPGEVTFEAAIDLPSATGFEWLDGAIALEAGHAVLADRGERVACLRVQPAEWNGTAVIWPHARGLAGQLPGDRNPAAAALLRAGHALVLVDLFGQAEQRGDPGFVLNQRGDRPGPADTVEDSYRKDCSYAYGYNDSAYARRVHDLLTLIAAARDHATHPPARIVLVGDAGAGHWVAGAVAAACSTLDGRRDPPLAAAVIDVAGFRFDALPDVWHDDFLPGAVKYGDIVGMLAMAAPLPLWVADPDARFIERMQRFTAAAGKPPEGPWSRAHSGPVPPWVEFVHSMAQSAARSQEP